MSKYLYILILIFAFLSCNNADNWDETKSIGTLDAYREYVKNNADSKNVEFAKNAIDSIEQKLWDSVNNKNSELAFNRYLKLFPKGKYNNIAEKKLDSLQNVAEILKEWEDCLSKNDSLTYTKFIDKYKNSVFSLKAEKHLFIIENPQFADKYKKILNFFEKTGKGDFSNISFYFAYKTKFDKETFSDEEEADTSIDKAVLDSIRQVKLEPKTPPYTKEQLFEYGFENISNKDIYLTFLRGKYNDNTRSFVFSKDRVDVNIEYIENNSKGLLNIIWVYENGEWCISEFKNSLPKKK